MRGLITFFNIVLKNIKSVNENPNHLICYPGRKLLICLQLCTNILFCFVEVCFAAYIINNNKKIICQISKSGFSSQIVKNFHYGYNLTECINL